MFPTYDLLRHHLLTIIGDKHEQGHVTAGLGDRLAALPDSYDALIGFAAELAALPMRDDWPYVEPTGLAGVLAECDPSRPAGPIGAVDPADAARRVEAAFLGSVCGCVLGKPLEINPTLDELRTALSAIGDWPLRDYVSHRIQPHLRPLHESWPATVRERIAWVSPDDDINYTVMGMLVLEAHGEAFTAADVAALWQRHLPPGWCYGPERAMLIRAAIESTDPDGGNASDAAVRAWASVLNPGDELCGAMIRADAYGYACPGDPARAAELAWRDASWTHRRTGVYGTMFAAAAIAAAPVAREPLDMFEAAIRFVPRRSRFYRIVSDSLTEIAAAGDWEDGYRRIHGRYAQYSHCRVYQETGTLMNTLRFAENVGDGICKQVMQGNDTDSYGATAGSMLGAYFGPGHLDPRWLAPFHDTIHTTVAGLREHSLSALAARMGRLPQRRREASR